MRLSFPARHIQADVADDGLGQLANASMPAIRARSTPLMRCSSRPTSNCGAWLPAFRRRLGPERCPLRGVVGDGSPSLAGSATLSPIPFRCCSSSRSHSVIRCWYRVVHRDFLLKHKHEVWLPRPFEALGDRVTRGMNTGVAEGGERRRIPLAFENRADHALPRSTRSRR